MMILWYISLMYELHTYHIYSRHVYYGTPVRSPMADHALGSPITMTGRIVKSGPRFSITIPPEYLREELLAIDVFYEITLRPVKKVTRPPSS
ncbi:MAG: hypothetical protein RBG13Loki_3601 [Promethearchaeota archaeon CR_4]|nr:MAG: hypothetical protein RBG13Loki_3601 [Candidatus Lokiarchaeota archaeon CR_4]